MDIYEEKFIIKLFDRMSKTYGTVNYFSSFGFTARWRKQCVQEINWDKKWRPDMILCPEWENAGI